MNILKRFSIFREEDTSQTTTLKILAISAIIFIIGAIASFTVLCVSGAANAQVLVKSTSVISIGTVVSFALGVTLAITQGKNLKNTAFTILLVILTDTAFTLISAMLSSVILLAAVA